MLKIINESLAELLTERLSPISSLDRINLFLSRGVTEFNRKNYMNYFKTISSATASRDLKLAVDQKLVKKTGDKNKATYKAK
jgi:predicted HTH transcriptional regulator